MEHLPSDTPAAGMPDSCTRRRFLALAAGVAGSLASGEWLIAKGARNGAGNAEETQSIGGLWRVSGGDDPTYFYQDGDDLVDLFTYHKSDSNKDGIPNLRLSHDERSLLVASQGYPNHPTAVFPNTGNPNRIVVQDFHFRLPLRPQLSDIITRVPMGPIGMALNGVVFFNPFEMGGMNAVEGYSEVWLDSCCGHPQQHGVYHYHKYPTCVKSPFRDEGKRHSPVIGFAWDGFPLYGPYESDGSMARDLKGRQALDVCNGHTDSQRGYHYHVTPGKFPYIIGGYHGIVETSNSHELRRGQPGAIENNASGESRIGTAIKAIRPGSVERDKTHTVRIELNPAAFRQFGVPNTNPTWVQIGPYEATKITRDKTVIEAEIAVPEDATLGVLLDCHIEFKNPNGNAPIVVKKNEVLRIIAGGT